MSEIYAIDFNRESDLYHFGHKGMKWGQHLFGRDERVGSKGRDADNEPKTEGGHGSKSSTSTADKDSAVKEAAIRSGDARMVARYSSMMSNKELKDAMERIETQKKLNAAVAATEPDIWKTIDVWGQRAGKVATLADNLGKIGNQAMKAKGVYDTYKKGKKTPENKDKQDEKEPESPSPKSDVNLDDIKSAINTARAGLDMMKSASSQNRSDSSTSSSNNHSEKTEHYSGTVEGKKSSSESTWRNNHDRITRSDDDIIDAGDYGANVSIKNVDFQPPAVYNHKASGTRMSDVDINDTIKKNAEELERWAKRNKDIADKY